MKTIQVLLFAQLREHVQKSQIEWFTEAETAGELYCELAEKFQWGLEQESLAVAVDDSYVPWGQVIKSGQRVAIIPPVSGG